MDLHKGRCSQLAMVTLAGLLLLEGCEGATDGEHSPSDQPSDSPAKAGGEQTPSAPQSSNDAPAAVSDVPTPTPGPDQLEGDLEVLVADHDDGTTYTNYTLVTAAGDRHALSFPADPSLATGDRVRVQGVAKADSFDVQGMSLLNETDEGTPTVLALINNPTRQTAKVAALLVNWGSPDSVTASSLGTSLFTSTTSAAEFHREVSYNLNAIGGDVFGWLTIPAMTNCDTTTLATNARNAAAAQGIDLSKYGQIAYYFPNTSQCSWAGLAQVGRPKSPARDSWFNGYSTCGVLSHELGHNIGAQHARSYDCGSTALGAPASCTYSEYGDPYDVMGGGNCTHPSTYLKAAEGWFGGCNVVTATANGTFDLTAIELPSNAPQGLRIPMDASLCPSGLTSCFYYVEARQSAGKFDTKANTAMFAGVLIHVGSAVDFSGNGRPQVPYLLDTTPNSNTSNDFRDSPLGVGKTFNDGKGVSITVNNLTAAGAKVSVSVTGGAGAPTCLDGTTYSAGGTTNPPDAGTPVVDAGTPRVDAGTPVVDAGGPRDAGTPVIDAGTPVADAGRDSGGPVVVVDAGTPDNGCGAGGQPFNGRCYAATTTTSTFDSALAACKARGAGWALAEINSSQENQFVSSLIGTRESYLGGTDRAKEGTWVWNSGTAFYGPTFLNFFYGPLNGRYTSFVSGEPNDGGGNSDCLRMVSGGGWRDGNCADLNASVCEK